MIDLIKKVLDFKGRSEEKRKRKWREYCDKMQAIATKYVNDNNLKFGSRYRGDYFCGDKTYEGELIGIDASSDGIFVSIKLESGKIHGDILAYSLKLIKQ